MCTGSDPVQYGMSIGPDPVEHEYWSKPRTVCVLVQTQDSMSTGSDKVQALRAAM